MAINGEGFFIIRRPDNSFGFTRDGSFVRDRNGQMVTSQGFILEPGIMIPDNAQQINVSRDGVVNVILQGSVDEQTLGQIQLARFINPAGLRSIGENVFVETVASGPAVFEQPGINNTGEIIQSYIESSNVDLVQEMVNMIVAQRAYEINSKSVQTADTILGTAVQLKR
jgi:flagellar basal-body rod protein FlgG